MVRSFGRVGTVFLWAIAIASCGPPQSVQPLSDPAQAKADPKLSGVWSGDINGSVGTLHLMPTYGAHLDVVLVGNDGEKGAAVLTFDAFPSTVAGKSYLNLRARSFKGAYADSSALAPEFVFARYEFGKDGGLTLWVMDDEPVKASIEAGKLKGVVADGQVKLTASTKELAEYVRTADPEKLFNRLGTFRKMRLAP